MNSPAVPSPPRPKLGPTAWTLLVGIGCFVVTIPVASVISVLLPAENPEVLKLARENAGLLVLLLAGAPFLETFIGQWLPTWGAGFIHGSTGWRVLVSALVFALLHLSNSPANAATILLVPGPVFAYTFVAWRRVSRWHAYLVTSLTHAVHNLCAGAILLAAM